MVFSWGVASVIVKLFLLSLALVEIAPLYHEPRPTAIFTEVPREVKSCRAGRAGVSIRARAST